MELVGLQPSQKAFQCLAGCAADVSHPDNRTIRRGKNRHPWACGLNPVSRIRPAQHQIDGQANAIQGGISDAHN